MDTYEGLSDGEILDRAEELIEKGDLCEAKAALDAVREKSGRRYFVESKFFKNKGWFNEERKCLKKALKAEPENEDYKKAMEELERFRKSSEYKEMKKQMGFKEVLADACGEGCVECCCYCTCTAICEGIGDGC